MIKNLCIKKIENIINLLHLAGPQTFSQSKEYNVIWQKHGNNGWLLAII